MTNSKESTKEPANEQAPTSKHETRGDTLGLTLDPKLLKRLDRLEKESECGILDTVQSLTKQKVRRRDRIVNTAWYTFLIVMLYLGGSSILGHIFEGGYLVGWSAGNRAAVETGSTRVNVDEIVSAVENAIEVKSSQVQTPPVTLPVDPAPPQSVIIRVEVPEAPAQNVPKAVSPPMTDAEWRNEALKDRLRQRYHLPNH